jgi:hypothetical protein
MPIYASTVNVAGTISGLPIYANNLAADSMSNIDIQDDVHVNGDIYTAGRLDTKSTMYATFRLTSNVSFTTSELHPSSELILRYDETAGDLSTISKLPLVLPNPNDFNDFSAGYITLPVTGLYNIQVQGAFENDPAFASIIKNGVYFKLLNRSHPNARLACDFSPAELVSTAFTSYLNAGDQMQPIFYSNDPNASLVATNGETYVTFTVVSTNTQTAPIA